MPSSPATIRVGIAFGSNQGDRLRHLQAARDRLIQLPQIAPNPSEGLLAAPVFESAAVDCGPSAPPFLNTAVEVACTEPFSPVAFLAGLRDIEVALGRPLRHPRNVARTIDLDLLYAGEMRCDEPGLTLPHPRAAQRAFVLAPLAAIRPDLTLPGERHTVTDLLRELHSAEPMTPYASKW